MRIATWSLVCVVLTTYPTFAADASRQIVTGLASPESACLGPDGAIFVTEIGEFGKDGDGQVSVIRDGKRMPFAAGLDDPKGIDSFANEAFFVADKTRVVRIDIKGISASLPRRPAW